MSRITAVVLESRGPGLRALAVGKDGTPVADRTGPASKIRAVVANWQTHASGPTITALADAGPWRDIPCPPLPSAAPTPNAEGAIAVPGLRQASPAETVSPAMALRLGGLLAADPGLDGVVCIPGDQGIWAHLSAGEVVGVLRVTTGAVFAALFGPEVPKHDPAFDTALSDCLSRPERLMRLLGSPDHPAATQAGALIGAELAAARPWWLGQHVRVLGRGGWPALYAHALQTQGVHAIIGDGDAALIAGVSALCGRAR